MEILLKHFPQAAYRNLALQCLTEVGWDCQVVRKQQQPGSCTRPCCCVLMVMALADSRCGAQHLVVVALTTSA